MTPKARRQALIVAGVLAVVAAVFYSTRDEAVPAAESSAPSNAAAGAGQSVPVVDVQLELLKRAPAEAQAPERNPFRFEAKAPPPAPARRTAAAAPSPPPVIVPPAPQGPPPPPPIPLRFIGLVDAPTQSGRVAIFSDGRGNVIPAKEGDIIEGRYRLLRVGPDSADLAFTDGRGRQTIRLSGQ
jgi:hypothetical protein